MNNIEKALSHLDPSSSDFVSQYTKRKMKLDHVEDLRKANRTYIFELLEEILMIQCEHNLPKYVDHFVDYKQILNDFIEEQHNTRGLRSKIIMYDDLCLGMDENGNRVYEQ